jgi:O-antigen/teichoic acid export membrane protein
MRGREPISSGHLLERIQLGPPPFGHRMPSGGTLPRKADVNFSEISRSGLKGSPFFRIVTLTMAVEVMGLLSRIVIVSVLGRSLGTAALAEYLLMARVTAWFLAGTDLGLDVALPRYMALAASKRERGYTFYFQAASLCLMLSSIALGLVMVAFRHAFARWIFGGGDRAGLVVALALMLCGLATQAAVYGYYQGLLEMRRANLLEAITNAAVPLGVVTGLWWTHSIPWLVGTMGCLDLLWSLWFARPILRELVIPRVPELIKHAKELLHYSLPRMPGEFGTAALTALGPIIASHYLPMEQLSAFLLGQSILMVVGYAAGPLDVVLLSKVSMVFGWEREAGVRRRFEYLVPAVLEVSIFLCLQLIIFADVGVRMWVGREVQAGMLVIRILMLAVPPYLVYMALRSSLDAATVTPLNARNVLVSLAVYVLLMGTCARYAPKQLFMESLAASLVLVLLLLGILTLRAVQKLYGLHLAWRRSSRSLFAALGLGAAAFIFRSLHTFPVRPVQAVLVVGGLTSAYFAILTSFGSAWLLYTWRMIFGECKTWTLPLLRCEVTVEGEH